MTELDVSMARLAFNDISVDGGVKVGCVRVAWSFLEQRFGKKKGTRWQWSSFHLSLCDFASSVVVSAVKRNRIVAQTQTANLIPTVL